MDIQKLKKKLQAGKFIIECIVECWCDFDWDIVDGALSFSDSHDDNYFLNRLIVDGEAIAEYDYERKDITTYHGLSQKDISDDVMLELMKDISRDINFPWILEHDDFRKAGSLVEFLREGGYAVEVYGSYFLVVDYGDDRASWVNNQEWVDQFIGPNGPLENPTAYFLFVDNTRFQPEIMTV